LSRGFIVDSTTTWDAVPAVTVMPPETRLTLMVAGCDAFDSGTVVLSCAAASAAHMNKRGVIR
jgi:hypothetical protein